MGNMTRRQVEWPDTIWAKEFLGCVCMCVCVCVCVRLDLIAVWYSCLFVWPTVGHYRRMVLGGGGDLSTATISEPPERYSAGECVCVCGCWVLRGVCVCVGGTVCLCVSVCAWLYVPVLK